VKKRSVNAIPRLYMDFVPIGYVRKTPEGTVLPKVAGVGAKTPRVEAKIAGVEIRRRQGV
jgi:hypothetical protein